MFISPNQVQGRLGNERRGQGVEEAEIIKRRIFLKEQYLQILKEEAQSVQEQIKELRTKLKRPGKDPGTVNSKGPVVATIPLLNGADFPIYQADIDSWKGTYPAIDVPRTLRVMREWCLSNPKKRKTVRGARRFITSWLEREQNRGGRLPLEVSGKPIDTRPAVFPKKQ